MRTRGDEISVYAKYTSPRRSRGIGWNGHSNQIGNIMQSAGSKTY